MKRSMFPINDAPGAWVADSKRTYGPLFSELDALLRALDRFFIAENFTVSGEDLTARNFHEELATAKDAILRILGILEVVIPESRKNAYWFRNFAETKLLTTGKRDELRERSYRQDSPEGCLYLLYDSFINLKGVVADMVRGRDTSFLGFMHIGRIISKEIRGNTYFNPFRQTLNPEFDEIRSVEISDIVKMIRPGEIKKYVSVIYLYLFRFLRFMDFIDIETQRPVSLNASLMILVLLGAEIAIYQDYIEKTARKIKDPSLRLLLQSVTYQFSMETRRVYLQELRDVYRKKGSTQFRGKIENSYGILKNLTEQNILQLAQFFRPDIRGEDLFASFVAKVERSLRLREDIVALHKILSHVQRTRDNVRARIQAFETLRKYMVYFESSAFRLLRHDDYEEFAAFFSEMNAVKKDTLAPPHFLKVQQRMAQFAIFIEATIRSIENRSELTHRPLDKEKVDALVRQHG